MDEIIDEGALEQHLEFGSEAEVEAEAEGGAEEEAEEAPEDEESADGEQGEDSIAQTDEGYPEAPAVTAEDEEYPDEAEGVVVPELLGEEEAPETFVPDVQEENLASEDPIHEENLVPEEFVQEENFAAPAVAEEFQEDIEEPGFAPEVVETLENVEQFERVTPYFVVETEQEQAADADDEPLVDADEEALVDEEPQVGEEALVGEEPHPDEELFADEQNPGYETAEVDSDAEEEEHAGLDDTTAAEGLLTITPRLEGSSEEEAELDEEQPPTNFQSNPNNQQGLILLEEAPGDEAQLDQESEFEEREDVDEPHVHDDSPVPD